MRPAQIFLNCSKRILEGLPIDGPRRCGRARILLVDGFRFDPCGRFRLDHAGITRPLAVGLRSVCWSNSRGKLAMNDSIMNALSARSIAQVYAAAACKYLVWVRCEPSSRPSSVWRKQPVWELGSEEGVRPIAIETGSDGATRHRRDSLYFAAKRGSVSLMSNHEALRSTKM
jgi:hypothetical protein